MKTAGVTPCCFGLENHKWRDLNDRMPCENFNSLHSTDPVAFARYSLSKTSKHCSTTLDWWFGPVRCILDAQYYVSKSDVCGRIFRLFIIFQVLLKHLCHSYHCIQTIASLIEAHQSLLNISVANLLSLM